MAITLGDEAIQTLNRVIYPLAGARTDYDRLLQLIGDARFVLLGEATHGTHEFYRSVQGWREATNGYFISST